MATDGATIDEINAKFETLQKEIVEMFEKLFTCLKQQKQDLLSRLSVMKTKHGKNTQLEKSIQQLRIAKDNAVAAMQSNHLAEIVETIKAGFDYNIRLMEEKVVSVEDVRLFEFRCASDQILRGIKETNLIELIPEYIGRESPILESCPKGIANAALQNARGVAIDLKKNEVYVTDQTNQRIQVLTTNGEFLRGFKHDSMIALHAICLSENDVFVTDKRSYLLKFSKLGKFLKKRGSRGDTPGCFAAITGICFEKESVYVCDSSLQWVQIFDSDFNCIRVFGYGEINSPTAMKFHSSKLYILSEDQNEIYCYSKNLHLLDTIHLTGQSGPMTAAEFFTIDAKGNFLICDAEYSEIRIFSPNGFLKHTLGKGHLKFLCGIALDGSNAIICVNFGIGSKGKCFQKY